MAVRLDMRYISLYTYDLVVEKRVNNKKEVDMVYNIMYNRIHKLA